MRYIADLITAARRLSINEDFTEDANGNVTGGIGDDEILQYLNDAQDRLQSVISRSHPPSRPFMKSVTVSAVTNQQEYEVPDRVFYGMAIDQIEYSPTGQLSDFTVMERLNLFNNDTNTSNFPRGYLRSFGKFQVVPIPSTSQGTFRVMYERTLDDVDKRRGTIASHTDSGTQITALTLSTTDDDPNAINGSNKYLCVNDKDGVVTMYNIPYTSYDSSTGVVTLPAFTYQSGESITDGDFVTVGKYTTTHSKC